MNKNDQKGQACAPVHKPEQHATATKQTSGDKKFDDLVDIMLKKPTYQTPSK